MANQIASPKVVIVEPDFQLAKALQSYLAHAGLDSKIAQSAEQLHHVNFVITDYQTFLPHVVRVCQAIEANNPNFLAIVYNKNLVPPTREQQVRLWDNANAVGVLPGFFDPVIVTRASAQLIKVYFRGRHAANGQCASPIPPDGVYFDPAQRIFFRDGHAIRLTKNQTKLLAALMDHQGHLVPNQTLYERVWGTDSEVDIRPVRNLIYRLRTRIEPHPRVPRYIRGMRGDGYRYTLLGD